MILKVEDVIKSFRRIDPDCEVCRDLIGMQYPVLEVDQKNNPFGILRSFLFAPMPQRWWTLGRLINEIINKSYNYGIS